MNRFVWDIPCYLQGFLLWMLFRKRAHRTFPFFFTYTAFGIIASVARIATRGHHRPYFWAYWSTDAVYIILGTLSLFEVFRKVFGNATRVWWRHLLFPGIIAASFFLTRARIRAVPPRIECIFLWIVNGEVAVRFAQVLTFAALVSLTPILGLRWPRHSRGIATGFGMYATIMLWMTTKLSDSGTAFTDRWAIVSILAYSAALLIWIWAFRKPQSSEARVPEDPPVAESRPPNPGVKLLIDSSPKKA